MFPRSLLRLSARRDLFGFSLLASFASFRCSLLSPADLFPFPDDVGAGPGRSPAGLCGRRSLSPFSWRPLTLLLTLLYLLVWLAVLFVCLPVYLAVCVCLPGLVCLSACLPCLVCLSCCLTCLVCLYVCLCLPSKYFLYITNIIHSLSIPPFTPLLAQYQLFHLDGRWLYIDLVLHKGGFDPGSRSLANAFTIELALRGRHISSDPRANLSSFMLTTKTAFYFSFALFLFPLC